MGAKVIGVSVDHVPCLKAWSESLGGIRYPLLSDFWPHGDIARSFGVFRDEGYSERAIFVIDPDGVVTYVDVHDIEDQPDNEVLFAELAKVAPPGFDPDAVAPDLCEYEPPADAGLVMYCTPWCPDCTAARKWLDAQGIEYLEVDVSAAGPARKRAAALNSGALHTPTFELGGEACVDFRPERITRLLRGGDA